VKALGATLKTAYTRLCDGVEPAGLVYEPNFTETSAEALLARLESGRARDAHSAPRSSGRTAMISFLVRGTAARDFASEGQQRSLVLALRVAQAAWFQERSGIRPVLLADDVLGELDPLRRRRFWSAIDPESQVIATGTHLPRWMRGRGRYLSGGWAFVKNLRFRRRNCDFRTWQWVIAVFAALLVGFFQDRSFRVGMLFVVMFARIMPAKQATESCCRFCASATSSRWRRTSSCELATRLARLSWALRVLSSARSRMNRIDDRQARLMIATAGRRRWPPAS